MAKSWDLLRLMIRSECSIHEFCATFKAPPMGKCQEAPLRVDVPERRPDDLVDEVIVNVAKGLLVSLDEEVMVVHHMRLVQIRVPGEVRPAKIMSEMDEESDGYRRIRVNALDELKVGESGLLVLLLLSPLLLLVDELDELDLLRLHVPCGLLN